MAQREAQVAGCSEKIVEYWKGSRIVFFLIAYASKIECLLVNGFNLA
jgi:hypothetical protein